MMVISLKEQQKAWVQTIIYKYEQKLNILDRI